MSRQAITGYRVLGFLATAPVAVPGIVLGVGLFLSYTRPPFVLYGTLWILLIAFVTIALPAAYQQLQAAFRTVHPDLEEASRILGATRLRALWPITAPILRTSVIATWCFIFVGVIRELSAAIMLFTSETKVVSVLIFDLNESGDLGAIAVIGLIMLVITFAVVIAVNRIPGFGARALAQYVNGRQASPKSPSQTLVARIAALRPKLPAAVRVKCEDLLIDVAGLCLTARNEDYVKSALAGFDDDGPCTAIGHARTLTAAGAAFVNGTATHGEDFDDTFEGGPVHAGAVIVPAVLAACERNGRDGTAALRRHRHRQRGDVPAVDRGAQSRAQGGLPSDRDIRRDGRRRRRRRRARSHRQADRRCARHRRQHGGRHHRISGRRRLDQAHACRLGGAVRLPRRAAGARAASLGPRTVFEGTHGLFHGFAHTAQGDLRRAHDDFGKRWVIETLAFKLYPCGTMTHPYIDCARRLAARGIKADDIQEMVCEVAEGTVHRLWEPLAAKQRPSNGYGAKFSTPYYLAAGFVRGNVGLDAFTDEAVAKDACSRLPPRSVT